MSREFGLASGAGRASSRLLYTFQRFSDRSLGERVRSVPVATKTKQRDLFETANELPEGMRHAPELVPPREEQALLAELPKLPFKEFEFHGFLGKRRTVSFGWRYGFDGSGLARTESIPDFLLPVRERAAAFAALEPEALEHALLIEYGAGAAIGWHKDRPVFGDVIGISLLYPCTFR